MTNREALTDEQLAQMLQDRYETSECRECPARSVCEEIAEFLDNERSCNAVFAVWLKLPSAESIIQEAAREQKEMPHAIRCPRCGKLEMLVPYTKNCLSRHADIYVCGSCGAGEAIRAMKGKYMPFEKWWAYKTKISLYICENIKKADGK